MSKKILVIENDGAVAQQITETLASRGIEAQVSPDGQDAVEQARSGRPDLILLCVELPRASGYSICNKLKKDEDLKKIPLVITSAEATPETFEQHRKLKTRADDYLLKPFDPGLLLQRLARLIELPPEQSAASTTDGVDDFDLDEIGAEVIESADAAAAPKHGVDLDDDDLKLLDRAFDELAASGGELKPLAANLPSASAPAVETPLGAAAPAAPPQHGSPGQAAHEALRAQFATLTAELERARRALDEAQASHAQRVTALEGDVRTARESARAAAERADAAEARATTAERRAVAAEARLKRDDTIREKTRKALALALQLLEEPASRAAPGEVLPRRE